MSQTVSPGSTRETFSSRRETRTWSWLWTLLGVGGIFALLAPWDLSGFSSCWAVLSFTCLRDILMHVEFIAGAAILGTCMYIAAAKWFPRS